MYICICIYVSVYVYVYLYVYSRLVAFLYVGRRHFVFLTSPFFGAPIPHDSVMFVDFCVIWLNDMQKKICFWGTAEWGQDLGYRSIWAPVPLEPGPIWARARLGVGTIWVPVPFWPWANLGLDPFQPMWVLGSCGPMWAMGPCGLWAHLGPAPFPSKHPDLSHRKSCEISLFQDDLIIWSTIVCPDTLNASSRPPPKPDDGRVHSGDFSSRKYICYINGHQEQYILVGTTLLVSQEDSFSCGTRRHNHKVTSSCKGILHCSCACMVWPARVVHSDINLGSLAKKRALVLFTCPFGHVGTVHTYIYIYIYT